MRQTEEKQIEIKIPFLIPVIIIFVIVAQIYSASTNHKVEAVTIDSIAETEEVIEQEESEEIEHVDVEEEIQQESQQEQQTVTYTASNGSQYDIIATLNIPSLGIKYPILSTTTEDLLKVALNKFWGANPNEVGNMVVLGHNYKNSKFFGKLPNIELGAIVKITDLNGKTVDYKVYDKYVIDPEDTACTSQLTNGQTEITLITCYYENGSARATKRFVVKARAY